LGRHEEALVCFDKALELDPRYANAWYDKALVEYNLGRWQDAAHSYQQFLTLAPAQQNVKQLEYARQHLRELEGK